MADSIGRFPDLQTVAKALHGEICNGEVLAPGPHHSTKDRSLSVRPDPNAPDGFLVYSHASDDPIICKDYVRKKLGLEPFKPNGRRRASDESIERALMEAVALPSNKPKAKIVATYNYTDADGKLLYQVCRLEPKSFRQRQPDGSGGWAWKLDERRVLYRWPELLKFPDATIFITEGEKDTDRIISDLNLCATTVATGKWVDECVKALADRDVVILQDNDITGAKKALVAARALHGTAKSIRVVLLPDLPDGGDVSDWLDVDPTQRARKFVDVCFSVPVWEPGNNSTDTNFEPEPEEPEKPEKPEATAASLNEWDAGDDIEMPPPRGWLLGNSFARKFMSSLFGDGGTGKTAVRYAQLVSLATGQPLTGEYVFQRCRVLIISLEDDADELKRRIRAVLLHHKIDPVELKGWLFLSAPGASGGKLMVLDRYGRPKRGQLAGALEAIITKRKIDIITIDPFVKSHSVEENSNSAIDDVVQTLTDLAAKHNIAIDVPHHVSKGLSDPGNASRGRGASAMKDGGRLIYTLTPMSVEEAEIFNVPEEKRRLLIRMDSAKVNITKPLSAAKWFRLVGVQLGNTTELYPNGDEVQTVEPWVPPDIWADLSVALLNKVLTVIDTGLPDGNRYTDAPRADDRAAWRVVVDHAPTKTEGQAREVIKTWVKNGVLVRYEYANPTTRKPVKGLRVIPAKRPS
jgi:AAA domain